MEICENLKVLGVLHPGEQLKRDTISKYLDLYAKLQMSKDESLSPIYKNQDRAVNLKQELEKLQN